ncbi:ABC transporter permease [Rhodococcus erythropolis]
MTVVRRIALGLTIPLIVVVAYGLTTTREPNPFYPPLNAIAERFTELWIFDGIETDVVPSLSNLLAGFAIAVVAGVLGGLLLGRVRILREIFMPLISFGRSVPPIMLIPPLVLVLGIGDSSKIAIIAIGAVFPVLIATIDGLRQTDPALLDVARSMQLSRTRTTLNIWIPSAAPSMFGGIQSALQIALVLMVSSEMVAAVRGVGFVTMQAQLTFDAPSVWAGIVLLAILGFLLNFIFTLVRNRLLRWHIGMRSTSKSR